VPKGVALSSLIFQAIAMNVKPLVKYFPELQHLSPEQQRVLLEAAYQDSFGPDQKMRVWRNNLIGGGVLTVIALVFIMVIGPLLRLAPAVTATIMMLGVLPGFLFMQHKRFINELRPGVMRLLAQQQNTPQKNSAADKPGAADESPTS
jgi:hypothetical protein